MPNCMICNTRPATLPDRDSGSSKKKLCRICHGERLKDDLRRILSIEKRRRRLMLTDDNRRLLTELLGECWHEIVQPAHISTGIADYKYPGGLKTKALCSCGEYFWDTGDAYSHTDKANRSFTTAQDMMDLKKRVVDMGEWRDFALFAAGEWDKTLTLNPTANFIVEVFTDWLMDEIRFPELVAGWWWQEREVKG